MNDLVSAAEYLPPDLVLDKYHPENQEFFAQKRKYEQLLVYAQAKCRPRHVNVAKQHFRGVTNVKIAEDQRIAPQTVSAILKRKEIQQLLLLLRYYDGHMTGPTLEYRKRVLNEIMLDNKDSDPKVAMQALDQLNRIDGIYKDTKDTKVEITINNQFEKSPLDV